MEFNFNINTFFKEEISKVGSRLIPDGFIGDRREVQDCLSKVSYILTILGEKSAKAQGLQKVITSGEKLRNSDHVVYILIDPKGGSKGLGMVLGMLKIGMKHLYVFDAGGSSHEVTTKCVLDFYIHESKQRMGLGKKLFEHMLREERVDPVHLAIDKPSAKFLSFLLKHYGLQNIIPQMNNFVVFDGFFNNRTFGGCGEKRKIPSGTNSCGSRFSSGGPEHASKLSPTSHQFQSASTISINSQMPFFGRPAPHKPVTTMGMILQHRPSPSQQPQESGRILPHGPHICIRVQATFVLCLVLVSAFTFASFCGRRRGKLHLNSNHDDNPLVVARVGSRGEEDGEDKSRPEPSPHAEVNLEDTPPQQVELEEENQMPENASSPEIPEEKDAEIVQVKAEVFTPATPTELLESPVIPKDKIRVNSQGHLDLKFYHSSLW